MKLTRLPSINNIEDVQACFLTLYLELQRLEIQASETWDPASIAVGAMEAKDISVSGAVVGDFAVASFSNDLTDLALDAQVTATDTVTCVLSNNTGGAVDLASGTITVRVLKKEI